MHDVEIKFLIEIREAVNAVDDQIIPLLQQRFELIAQMKPYKKTLTDQKRESEILSKIQSYWVREVYQKMFLVSTRIL